MQVNKNKLFNISLSVKEYKRKEDINYSNIVFQEHTVNTYILLKQIIRGHSIAPCCYDYKNTLSINNIKKTSFIGIDIDKTNYKFNDFISTLTYKPTLSYTTFSHTEDNSRFRLLYVFDEPIKDINTFQLIYNKISCQVEHDTKEEIKDNCGKCFNRLFNGTDNKALTYINNIIYSISDFDNINGESNIKNIKTPHEEIKVSKYKEVIPQNIIDLLNEYDDYDKLFLHLIKDRENKVITESEVKYNTLGYADLKEDYKELKVIFDKVTKKPKIFKDGEGRKHFLYTRLQFRKYIKPSITMEELLTNALFDIKHFINNDDGEFHKQRVLDIVKSVYYDECRIKQTLNKKSFKVNKEYCNKNNITPNQYKMMVRRIKNDEKIGEWYDISKSVKENLIFAKENNVKVSRATLFRFCERNNINTKGNKNII